MLRGISLAGHFEGVSLGQEEGIDAQAQLAGEVILHLRVAAAWGAAGQAGGVRLRAVAQADEVDERLAITNLPAQHVGDAAPVGLEVRLLDGMAIDGGLGLLGNLPRAAEVTRGGGDEDLGRVHGNEISTDDERYIPRALSEHVLSSNGPRPLCVVVTQPVAPPSFRGWAVAKVPKLTP